MKSGKLLVAVAIVALVVAFFAFDLGHFLSLDYFKGPAGGIRVQIGRAHV